MACMGVIHVVCVIFLRVHNNHCTHRHPFHLHIRYGGNGRGGDSLKDMLWLGAPSTFPVPKLSLLPHRGIISRIHVLTADTALSTATSVCILKRFRGLFLLWQIKPFREHRGGFTGRPTDADELPRGLKEKVISQREPHASN